MKKRSGRKKIIGRAAGILVILLLLSGCTGDSADDERGPLQSSTGEGVQPAWQHLADEPITFDWYINYSWYSSKWGGNLVSDTITEMTGVSVKFITSEGNEIEKLRSMITADTLPDLITLGWWEEEWEEMVGKELVYSLNELADQYDPYFYQVTNDEIIHWYQYADGNLYCYPNASCSPSDMKENDNLYSNLNFVVRKDMYEAIGSPDMSTPEGFCAAIREVSRRFPTVNGKELIPIGATEFDAKGCPSFDKYLQNFLAVPYEKDGAYYDRNTDEEYI